MNKIKQIAYTIWEVFESFIMLAGLFSIFTLYEKFDLETVCAIVLVAISSAIALRK